MTPDASTLSPSAPSGCVRVGPLAILVFVVLALGAAWAVALPLWVGDGMRSPWYGLVASLVMFTPTVAALVVVFALRAVPKGQRARFLGLWPLRPAKRVVWLTVLGLLAPAVLAFASVLVAGAFGWITLDLVHLSGFAQVLQTTLPAGVEVSPWLVVVSQFVMMPLAAATINAFLAFGEELGWRGFLVPALRRYGTFVALVVSGAVWGVWHAPLILLGHNFGRTDLTGVLVMTGGCVAWGVLLGWLRLRSASVWPAVFAHGMMNASLGMTGLFFAAGTTFDPVWATGLGVAGWVVCAVVIVLLWVSGQFGRQPELAQPREAADSAAPGVARS